MVPVPEVFNHRWTVKVAQTMLKSPRLHEGVFEKLIENLGLDARKLTCNRSCPTTTFPERTSYKTWKCASVACVTVDEPGKRVDAEAVTKRKLAVASWGPGNESSVKVNGVERFNE